MVLEHWVPLKLKFLLWGLAEWEVSRAPSPRSPRSDHRLEGLRRGPARGAHEEECCQKAPSRPVAHQSCGSNAGTRQRLPVLSDWLCSCGCADEAVVCGAGHRTTPRLPLFHEGYRWRPGACCLVNVSGRGAVLARQPRVRDAAGLALDIHRAVGGRDGSLDEQRAGARSMTRVG